MHFFKYLYLVMALLSVTAQAENDYAQATTAQTNVFLGQVFTVDVIVKAAEKPNAPNLENLYGFNITVLDAGSPTSTTNTFLFRYAFRATETGELTIPPLRFGSSLTNPLTIQAKKPTPTDRMKLTTALSATSVYLGEPVVLTTIWDSAYPFSTLKAVDFNFPILNDPRFQVLEPYEPEKEKNAQTTGLPVHGTRVLATRKSYKTGNVQHQSLTFRKILIPKKSGTLSIPPSTLLCAAEKGQESIPNKNRRSAFQYPAYFDNTFFDQNLTGGDYTRIYTESAPLHLEVKPLPTEGRPDLFNGMVGNYTISVTAEPTAVRVNEPITLTITVTADQFVENIFFPPLRYQPELINRFEIPKERSLPQRTEKSKIYTQTIRPLSADLTEVPPIELAYFNPASNAYLVARSQPIPLKVSPAEAIASYDENGTPYRTRLRATEGGIRQNYEAPDMLKNKTIPLFRWAHPALVIPLLLLPPLLAGLLALGTLLSQKKHQIHRTAKAARAYKIYRKNAAHIIRNHKQKSAIYNDLDRVLRAYLGDRLHLKPGALSFREAETQLPRGQETQDLKQLFETCEAYRFTTNYDEPGNAKQIVRNANRIVKAIEKGLK